MELPTNAKRHFAEQKLDAAYKYQSAVQESHVKESKEDRRAFERFYNNLALFSGGTIALSITYLGYLKTLSKALRHQKLLTASWISLFICLLFSLAYVLINLNYAFYYRQRELAEAEKKKFETEADEMPNMNLVNLQTSQELAAYQNPRRERARVLAGIAEKHGKKQDRFQTMWHWAGIIAQLGFISGIGMLMWFAISNI